MDDIAELLHKVVSERDMIRGVQETLSQIGKITRERPPRLLFYSGASELWLTVDEKNYGVHPVYTYNISENQIVPVYARSREEIIRMLTYFPDLPFNHAMDKIRHIQTGKLSYLVQKPA